MSGPAAMQKRSHDRSVVMKVAVYGAGALGGYFGARLAAGGADVTLIARGAQLAALRADGLRVRSPLGDLELRLAAVADPSEVGPVDLVLFCVKSFDTEEAASRLGPLLRPETAVLSLQNGIDNEDRIEAVIGPGHVMGGTAFIFVALAAPGVIEHTGTTSRIVFGELDGRPSDRAERILDALVAGGVDAEITLDIRAQLWTKFSFICAVAGMTAAVRLPIGPIRDDPVSWAMFRSILEEVTALARAEGVDLTPDLVDRQLALTSGLAADSYSSLHHDLVNGRRMELEALHGTVVTRARAIGLAVPASEATYAILRPWADRNRPTAGH